MALESATWVDDLVTSNPAGLDAKQQGDDHIRLLKSTLKTTFPNATRAFYFETVSVVRTGAYTIVAADQRSLQRFDTSSAAITVTLPLIANVFAGFVVSILLDVAGNDLTIDGNGTEKINGVETLILDQVDQVVTLMSDGAEWKVVAYGLVPAGLRNAADVTITGGAITGLTDLDMVDATAIALAQSNLELVGQQTIWLPAVALIPRVTNGPSTGKTETTTNKVVIASLDFAPSTEEKAQFTIQMPKSWDEGTIIAQFVWTHPSTTVNFGVVWGIRAVALANDDALDSAFGSEVAIADTGGTTDDVYITGETPAMTVAGTPAAEEFVVFEVSRKIGNPSDDMAVDAKLLGVRLHYTTDAARDN